YPQVPAEWNNSEIAKRFEDYLKVRGDVQKVLEGLRAEKTIGASLEAKVTVHAEGDLLKSLQNYADLREFLIVSAVELKNGAYKVAAEKAPGEKCVRCWVYSEEISQDPKHPGICPKCVEALT
ncbi:MAG TPA: zinc finger domain-containing protein, partial [Bdellovibrio sp.]|nr:zinc finger domain-containing protein [Bdellovibrio sp.]